MFAKVLVDVASRAITQAHFDYMIPEALAPAVEVGSRVLVPFGARRVQGFVVEVTDHSDIPECKPIEGVTDEEPLLPYELLALAQWMSDTYLCPVASCVRAMLPAGIRIEGEQRVELLVAKEEATRAVAERHGRRADDFAPLIAVLSAGPNTVGDLGKGMGGRPLVLKQARALAELGLARIADVWSPPRVRERIEMRLFPQVPGMGSGSPAGSALAAGPTPLQERIARVIAERSGELTVSSCSRECGCTTPSVQRVVEKGFATLQAVAVRRRPGGPQTLGYGHVNLTPEQEQCLEAVLAALATPDGRCLLLRGVTGSGKTEIYLRAIREVVDLGRDAIVLVPEISLTPQTVARFRERFGDDVAVLHSRLSQGEKLDEWMRIRRGEVRVAVGARSAVFAPFPNLGLVVIDEEHEPTYKQDEDPRYHAAEVALSRAEATGATVLLGSATPSIESAFSASQGRYTALHLTTRVDNRPLPPVEIVDMREELRAGNRSVFSRAMQEALGAALSGGEQAVVFLNRRGFNTFVLCRECGHVMACANCDVSLTFHADPPVLQCHYCGGRHPVPVTCPACGSRYIRYFGAGTQRIQAELEAVFPSARLLRMDVDTTSAKDAHARLLGQFGRGEADILIGTQMVAKGLDFPRVTVVGVVAADTSLNLPDYRAAERTFQLLTQVAGRAGRGDKPGRVVVQTYNPDHYAVRFAGKHDYDGFFERELAVRKELDLPPFTIMAQAMVSGSEEASAIAAAHEVADLVRGAADSSVTVLGPAPAPISRIEGRHRWHVVAKSTATDSLMAAVKVAHMGPWNRPGGDIRVTVAIRPASLL